MNEAMRSIGSAMENRYVFDCWGPRPDCRCTPCLSGLPYMCSDPICKWTEDWTNLVVTVGLNDLLDKYFAGSAYTAAWFMALKGTGSVVAGDTMGSHAGWTEVTAYSQSTRPALVFNAASAGSKDNVGNLCTYSINAAVDVYGAFIATNSTKGGTTGILYGGGFFAGGSITGVTKANPGVVSVTAHGLNAGEKVLITGVSGMTQLNGNVYQVGSPSSNAFNLLDQSGANIDTTGFGTWTSGGLVERQRHADSGDSISGSLVVTAASA